MSSSFLVRKIPLSKAVSFQDGLDWNLLAVAQAEGMLAEFGTERRGKSREI
jgi:hypothetical protein